MDVTRRPPTRLALALSKRRHILPTRRTLATVRPLRATWTDSRTRRTPDTTRSYATAPPADVAVIGGGMTGLTAAYYLARRLPASSRVTLYEGAEDCGGWVHTHKMAAPGGGVVHFEKGPRMLRGLGRTGFRGDDYVFYDLISDLKLPLRISPPRQKLFCYNNRLVHLPPRPAAPSLLRTAWQLLRGTHILSGMSTAALRYRRLRLRSFPQGTTSHDVSIGDWLRMNFGDVPAPRNLLSGMMHGIYGGDVDELGMASVLPAVWHGVHRRVGDGEELIPRQDYELLKELDPRTRGIEGDVRVWSVAEVMSFPDGMGTLVDGMREALERYPNVTIKTGAPVTRLQYREDQDKVELATASTAPALHDKVISTTPSASLAPLLPTLPLPTTSVSIMTVSFFYPTENLTSHHNAFGYLIPFTTTNPEQALGVFFDSDTYGLAPSEKRGTKLTVLMGGHMWGSKEEIPSKEECVRRARAMLERHLGLKAEPELTYANLAEGCIPQHAPSHRAILAQTHDALLESFKGRLSVAGGSYTAVGAMPAMRAGYDAACHVSGSPRAHVGDTGLAQFKEGLDVIAVPREELNALGKELRGSGALGKWFSGR